MSVTPHDLTHINQEKNTNSILPPELIAAQLFNKKNEVGTIMVELPVSNFEVNCYPLKSLDEISAKTISGSIQMYTEKNLELFWNCSEFPKDSWVKTFEDFKQLTEADFKMISFGVLKASFKTMNPSTFICKNKNCTNDNPDKIFKATPLLSDIKIDLPQGLFESPSDDYRKDTFISELDNITITYKFDSIGERFDIFKTKSNEEIRYNIQTIRSIISKLEMTPIFIESIKIEDPSLEKPIVLKDKSTIMIFINKLTPVAREIIEKSNDKYIDHILGYQPKFSADVVCPHCNTINTWEDIDLMVEFFLKLSTIY